MKKHLYRLFGLLLLSAVGVHGNAANGIIETKNYTICPGESITLTTRQFTAWSDTILYDTIIVAEPTMDSIYQYVVNVYPSFIKQEYHRLEQGDAIEWCDTIIDRAGTYEKVYYSIHGCDSIHRLELTVYHVDTIDTTAVLCPMETITWHGMTYGQTGNYEFPGTRTNGDKVYYRLHLTVKELARVDTTFTLCDNETLTFHGKTYANAGEYTEQYTCDSLFVITVVKYPSQLYLQTGVLDATHPYLWQYVLDGETKTDTINTPGVYEYTSQNAVTGCNDTYRLILTRDETTYRFDTAAVVCENEYFEWRGKKYLNRQGVGTTTHYYDNFKTQAGYDSIYHLALRVLPILHSKRTIPFCGSIIWNGETVTESKTIIDTLQSVQYGCDSIITTVLAKGIPFLHHDTATIMPGETIEWRGKTITHDGQFEDRYTTTFGCDSTYTLGVGLKADAPITNTRTWYKNICEGDYEDWFGKRYFNSGTYIDTVFVSGTTEIDSLHILHLTVNKTYASRERITFHTFPGTYRGHVFNTHGDEYEFHFTTAGGCDSIITVVAEQEITRYEETVVICPGQTYIWDWTGLTYRETGRYVKSLQDKNGVDSVEHILNLTVHYIPDTYITKTICKGATYTFGDRNLTESGNYTYTFHDTGCDSVVHLALNVLNSDTNTFVHHMDEHDSYVWNGETYTTTGVYYHYGTNRFGCDSISVLELTVNKVDTVSAKLTICPNEVPFEWNGIIAHQTGKYDKTTKQPNGDYVYYHLDLKVLDLVTVDTTLVICSDESISFNGQTYSEAGVFRNYLSCDTLMNVRVIKHPQQVYETNASLGANHGYTWTYWDNGVEQTNTFNNPGTYEFESPNATTGCSEIWRLVLTKDETIYHFVETQTICEGDDFSWRGMENLSGVPGTSHYYAEYQTRTGKDSIYELVLTVIPIERTVRTIKFCGETTWKGVTYTNSTVVYDTLAISTGCYRIERVNLDKETPFYHSESKELPQGTVLHWHGQNITTDGTYYDYNTTVTGCDSIYTITVTIIPASPETNQYAEELSTCEGDTIVWRGKDIWRSGVYVDTVYKAGTQNIDSIFTLHFTAWPAPKDTIYQHLYTCGGEASIRYQGQDYYQDTEIISRLTTIHGCDSIVKVYLHFNTALFLSDTVKIADTQLPYTWTYRLPDGEKRDTLLTAAGTYNHQVAAEGSCYNREQLVLLVYPTFLYEQDTTICELDLPFYWKRGPIEHWVDGLQHEVGTTKQYEYRYQTVNNTDSIYRLNLTIDEAPKKREQYYVCEGYPQWIRGKEYGKPGVTLDTLYRDTIRPINPNSICDSVVYVEVYVSASKQQTQVVVLHEGESIDWNNYHITTSGTWRDTTKNVGAYGCDSISTLRVIMERIEDRVICSNDTAEDVHPDKKYPYVWNHPYPGGVPDTLYTSGIYRDTTYDKDGYIENLYRLNLTITEPFDTTVVVHGCQNEGANWRDRIYYEDTTFVYRVENTTNPLEQPCDSVFHVIIKMDTIYNILIDTTLCEYQLPLIIGRIKPDTIWEEGNFRHAEDKTLCGCDSLISGHLTIIPKLTHNDSTFVCEDIIQEHPVWLGDTITPAFMNNDGGKWADKWQGKWHGVKYTQDTIVWDCDHRYFHHIIVRPSQKVPKDTTYYMCEGDSVQLFWPKQQWVKKDSVYFDTVPMGYGWTDSHHGFSYHDQQYLCDSVTRWTVKFVHPEFRDTTAHRQLGDSIWWGGAWRYYTGAYDSIGTAREKNSDSVPCRLTYTLHLIMDTAYYYRDTVDVCTYPNRTLNHTWFDGHVQSYTVGTKDTVYRHYFDSLVTVQRRDSIYDLCVNYRIIPTTHLYDTICEGTALRWDEHHRDNTFTERQLTTEGVYYDTIPAVNLCDSILIMHLYVRKRIPETYTSASIIDRQLPYIWEKKWKDEDGTPQSKKDSLYITGLFRDTLPSIHGCDSIVLLNLTVRPTYHYLDTVTICAKANTTLSHEWPDNYVQYFTTPRDKDTAIVMYKDTILINHPADSVFYDLTVFFHKIYQTHKYDTICAGDSACIDSYLDESKPKKYFKKTGIYSDTLTTIFGCDSILTLHLQVWPGFPTHYETVHINEADTPYLWPHSYMEAGVLKRDTDHIYYSGNYGRHLTNIHGCDSIDSLTIYFHPNYVFEDTLSICGYEVPYVWTGSDGTIYKSDIYESGTYTRKWRTVNTYGDSTHILHLEVLPLLYSLRYDTLCYGDSILFGKKNGKPRYIYEPGIYFDTLTSYVHGCDSVVEMRLNRYDNYLRRETRHIMRDELPYKWYHVKAATTDTVDTTTILSEGQFEYIFKTRFGCDSIDSLTLVVHDDYLYRDSVIICKDEVPYTWQGEDGTIYRDGIYESGEYAYTLRRADGHSDSTLIRKVTVRPLLFSLRYDTLCYGDSISFGLSKNAKERFLTKPGVYYDTLSSIRYGCDSIIEMRLNFFPHLHQYHSPMDITDKDIPFMWYHIIAGTTDTIDSTRISGFGEFEYVFKTPHGCDSTDHLTVNVHPNYYFRDSVSICSDATPYIWYGPDSTIYKSDIYESGEYTRHMRTADGFADSIHVRVVTVRPVVETVIRDSICESLDGKNAYTFNGRQLTKGDVYRDTLTAANGCDSIVTLYLSVNKPYYNYIERHIVEGYNTTVFGKTYDKDTTFSIVGVTPNGCDSVTDVRIVMHPMVDTVVTVCSNDLPYQWVNKWTGQVTPLYAAGIYRNDTTYDEQGKRLYYGLQLIVKQPKLTVINESICEDPNSYYLFGDQKLTRSDIYRMTLATADGCDSIIELHLTVNKPYYNYIERHIVEGYNTTVFGKTYDKDTTFSIVGVTPNGCDSVTDVRIVMHPMVDTVVTVCSNDLPYKWVNKWNGQITYLYAAGIYRNDTTYDEQGKQLFYGLQLIVNQPVYTTIRDSVCETREGIAEYPYRGRILTKSDVYRDTLTAANGCDSIVTLYLTVNKPYYNYIERHIVEGNSTTIFGKQYDKDTTFSIVGVTPNGCDSVTDVRVVMHPLVDTVVTVCASSLPYLWVNKWTGQVTPLYAAGLYRNDTTYDAEGRRVYYGLRLFVNQPVYASFKDTICEGDVYPFCGENLTTGGMYTRTIPRSDGCDSIVTLQLHVQPVYTYTERKTILEGASYFFNGEERKDAGIYSYTVPTANGKCFDTYQLLLNVVKPINIDTVVTVCENELPFAWKGFFFNEEGKHVMPIESTDTSRITMTLDLHINPVPRNERVVEMCEGGSYFYKNREYTSSCTFYDTVPSKQGCDSIIKFIIRVHPTYNNVFERHISDKDTVNFHQFLGLKTEGTYEWTGQSQFGCDSMEHLKLYVHPSYLFVDSAEICEPDTLFWRGQKITKTGLYYDSLVTMQYGYKFDSVYHLKVKAYPYYTFNEKYEIGEGEVIKLHGHDISKPGEYWDTLYTAHGCDSIFHVVVNKKHTIEFSSSLEICSSETPYVWLDKNKPLTRSGDYTYVSKYKDSIVHLHLTVNPISISEKRVVITDVQAASGYIYGGRLYDDLPTVDANVRVRSRIYTDTLTNQYGCDSILRLAIVVTKRYSEWIPIPLCPGSELKIDGRLITEAGLYTFERRSKATGEMDSLYRVEVYNAAAYDLPTEHRVICDGDTVFYGDRAITRGGHYDFALKTEDGCDSLLHIDLTVNPSYHFYQYMAVPDYKPYTWLGKTYTQTGVYDRTWPTMNDCDSTYTLDLMVVETKRDTITETICVGQSYTWRGKSYDVDGYYADTIWYPDARFSAIYALRLIVAYPTIITSAHTGEICGDSESFDIYFDYTGQKPTHYSVYFDQLAKREGFEDNINVPFGSDMVAHVNLPKFAGVAYEGHPYYVRPDYYTMRIALDNGVCGISRSDSLTLLVKYPSWILEQNWDDVVAPLKSDFNGGFEFAQTDWYINGILASANTGYLHSKELHAGDQVVMVATRKGESIAIPTCPLTIQSPNALTYETPVIVYPTQAPRHMPTITVEAPQDGLYEIFSSTGLMVSHGKLEEGKTSVTLPAINGIYFIRAHQGNEISSHKVILY